MDIIADIENIEKMFNMEKTVQSLLNISNNLEINVQKVMNIDSFYVTTDNIIEMNNTLGNINCDKTTQLDRKLNNNLEELSNFDNKINIHISSLVKINKQTDKNDKNDKIQEGHNKAIVGLGKIFMGFSSLDLINEVDKQLVKMTYPVSGGLLTNIFARLVLRNIGGISYSTSLWDSGGLLVMSNGKDVDNINFCGSGSGELQGTLGVSNKVVNYDIWHLNKILLGAVISDMINKLGAKRQLLIEELGYEEFSGLGIKIKIPFETNAQREEILGNIQDNKPEILNVNNSRGFWKSSSFSAEELGFNTSSILKMADNIEVSTEDMSFLKAVAEHEAINRYTTAEIKVEQINHNNVDSSMDINGITNKLVLGLQEATAISKEGVSYI